VSPHNGERVYKIGDFGLVCRVVDWLRNGEDGDKRYVPLDLLKGRGKSRNYDPRCADIFSLGLTMWELATARTLPDKGDSWTAIRRGAASMALPAHSPFAAYAPLIASMLSFDPCQRPTARELLEHPLFGGANAAAAVAEQLHRAHDRIAELERELALLKRQQ
jgi:wee1-like protein kinase